MFASLPAHAGWFQNLFGSRQNNTSTNSPTSYTPWLVAGGIGAGVLAFLGWKHFKTKKAANNTENPGTRVSITRCDIRNGSSISIISGNNGDQNSDMDNDNDSASEDSDSSHRANRRSSQRPNSSMPDLSNLGSQIRNRVQRSLANSKQEAAALKKQLLEAGAPTITITTPGTRTINGPAIIKTKNGNQMMETLIERGTYKVTYNGTRLDISGHGNGRIIQTS